MDPISELNKLTLEEKIGQMFMIGFQGVKLSKENRNFIKKNNIGFVILFFRNVLNLKNTVKLTNQIHQLAKIQPFIFTDQEGGTVIQFGELTSTMVSHQGLAHTQNTKNAQIAGSIIGQEMDLLGIDGVFAPVLDINRERDNPIIGIRSFSNDPNEVKNYGYAFFKGIKKHNILACAKHFPGHGDTREDSHHILPILKTDLESLKSGPLIPFEYLISKGIDGILSSHILFKNINDKIASFDPFIMNTLLRKKARFEGISFSDCLEMEAIKKNHTAREIILKALNAGIDIMVISHSFTFQKLLYTTLLKLLKKGEIKEDRIDKSVKRILNIKEKYLKSLSKRKSRDVVNIGKIRSKETRKIEASIARESINILKNNSKKLPIKKKKSILLIEWEKVKATQSLKDAKPYYMVKKRAKEKFVDALNFESVLLKLDGRIPERIKTNLESADYIICAVFFRSKEIRVKQVQALKKILKIRSDIIVVSLGNPLVVEDVENVSTLINTYGFRSCQIEALFNILSSSLI